MIVHDVQQGTPAWIKLRAGIPTASNFSSILTRGGKDGKPKRSESCEKYMNHLLAERVIGKPIDGFQSEWMARGNDFEDKAVAAYEIDNDCDTERIGFVTTDDGLIGCSPDRIIRQHSRGLVEAKAPSPAVHISYLLSSVGASSEYKVQLQGQLWVCERDWVDIISYHPDMPRAVFRVNRDEEYIKELSAHVRAFSVQLEERVEQFRERGWIKVAAPISDEFDGLGISEDDLARMYPYFPVSGLMD